MNYNYYLGNLKAYKFMAHNFKEESEKILEEVKLKIKHVRDSME